MGKVSFSDCPIKIGEKDITERLPGYFSCLIYEMFGLENSLKGLRTFVKIFSFIHLLGNLLWNVIPGF